MFKKISLIALCFLMIFSLSACSIPFTDKVVTLPFFEKNPEQAVSLMMEAMTNLRSYEFSQEFQLKAEIDLEKLENTVSLLPEKNTANYSNGASALDDRLIEGNEDDFEDEFSNNDFELPEPLMLEEESMLYEEYDSDYGSSNPLAGPINAELNFQASGKIDKSDKDNPRLDSIMSVKAEAQGFSVSTDASVVQIGKKAYFKLDKLVFPMMPEELNPYLKKWWLLDSSELKAKQDELSEIGMGELSEFVNYNDSDNAKKEELENKLTELFRNTRFIKITKRFKDEKINGKKNYHYQYEIDKSKIGGFIEETVRLMKENLKDEPSFEMVLDSTDEIISEFIIGAEDMVKEFKGELWIDKDDFFLSKSLLDFKFDLGKFNFEGETVPEGAFVINVSAGSVYSNHNQAIDIKEPQGAGSVLDEVSKQIENARTKARDAKRLSDIKQIQTALELYYSDSESGTYPKTIKIGEKFALDDIIYLYRVPSNPIDGENNTCKDQEYEYFGIHSGLSYGLKYCLENTLSGIRSGINIASPAGMIGGTMEDTIEIDDSANTDSDLDGLTNAEEKKYGTDINNADTDGDGYLDGSEVKAGYNPLSEGKLIK